MLFGITVLGDMVMHTAIETPPTSPHDVQVYSEEKSG
jgi:hypothetical protein